MDVLGHGNETNLAITEHPAQTEIHTRKRPLINETVKRLENQKPPREMQTGPAVRNDTVTINRHINQLQEYPEILQLYKLMTHHIEDYYK